MLTKNKIKQSFETASSEYDSVALLQRTVGKRLLETVGTIDQYDTIVDIGCGTGSLINELTGQQAQSSAQVIALDIALPMLQIARNKLNNNALVSFLCADAECLPFKSQSADLLISNLAFQWCGNLEKTFADIKRIMKPEGRFAFTTFGAGTLHELKSAWQAVDDYVHVNIFYDEPQLMALLQQAGFQQIKLETHTYISTYESVWDLMAELKQLGAHTVIAGGNQSLTTKAKMQRMICAYQKQDKNGLVPATFEVLTVTAKA